MCSNQLSSQTLSHLGPSAHLLFSLLLRHYQNVTLLQSTNFALFPQVLFPLPAVLSKGNGKRGDCFLALSVKLIDSSQGSPNSILTLAGTVQYCSEKCKL